MAKTSCERPRPFIDVCAVRMGVNHPQPATRNPVPMAQASRPWEVFTDFGTKVNVKAMS